MKSIIALNNQTVADLCLIATGGLSYLPEFCLINGITADETPEIGKAYYYDYIENLNVVSALTQSTQQPATNYEPSTPSLPVERLYAAGDGIDITNDIISADIDGESIVLNDNGKLQAVADTDSAVAECKAYTDAAKTECKQYTDTAKTECKAYTDAAIPAGVILLWSGTIADIPTGWALCDGQNNTPDLRDRFIVGAGSSYSVGDTGGANDVTLTIDQTPAHTHTRGTMEITGSTKWLAYDACWDNTADGAFTGYTNDGPLKNNVSISSTNANLMRFNFKASKGWTGATSEVGGGQEVAILHSSIHL